MSWQADTQQYARQMQSARQSWRQFWYCIGEMIHILQDDAHCTGAVCDHEKACALQAEGMLAYSTPSYQSLCEGAQQYLKAAGQPGKHPSLLQEWLGPAEALALHATKRDIDLMVDLQCSLFERLEARTFHFYQHPNMPMY